MDANPGQGAFAIGAEGAAGIRSRDRIIVLSTFAMILGFLLIWSIGVFFDLFTSSSLTLKHLAEILGKALGCMTRLPIICHIFKCLKTSLGQLSLLLGYFLSQGSGLAHASIDNEGLGRLHIWCSVLN